MSLNTRNNGALKSRTAERRTTKQQNGPNRKWQHFPVRYNWLVHAVLTGSGFSGCQILWSSPKCCHFLFHLPNRKWQHLPWSIRAIFTCWISPLCSASGETPSCENDTDQSIKGSKTLVPRTLIFSIWSIPEYTNVFIMMTFYLQNGRPRKVMAHGLIWKRQKAQHGSGQVAQLG